MVARMFRVLLCGCWGCSALLLSSTTRWLLGCSGQLLGSDSQVKSHTPGEKCLLKRGVQDLSHECVSSDISFMSVSQMM